MKTMNLIKIYLITVFVITFILTDANACQLSIPESYVPTFLAPPVSGDYEKCEKEPCHCVDKVNPYFSELIDNEVIDYVTQKQVESCTDELDCDEKFTALVCDSGDKIKNYEQLSVYCAVSIMKIEGKKLVESAEKKQAHESIKALEKQVKIAKINKLKAAKDKIKSFEFKATNIAGLKAELNDFREALKEVQE